MNLLARREHSCREMRQKLKAKGFDPEHVEQTLAALLSDNLLSDERFAESFVRSRVNKGVGPARLRNELREHEIDSALVSHCMQDQDWTQLAVKVRLKRFGPARPENYEDRAKQMRFLQYRGFETEQINGAMKHSEWELEE